MDFKSWKIAGLNISLSRVQTIVGLMAGILSITGGVVAFFKPASDHGRLVAIVQDAKTKKAITDATVEILTPADVLVTTLRPNSSGEASCTLEEGHYRVRVNHPRYASEVRDVRLISQQNTEVHVQLRGGRSLGGAVRRVFGH
jgi:hypothetical protein